ncbi:Mediator-associated protein 1 [Morella rubra]|uniref:Mediator-associated protein 1 n=1 Tax=Morella rubra TaxID=262757 RepID=A0A6A1VGK3_9ROSI|nr:Mediator-associated protein 1 [Morella rubra]
MDSTPATPQPEGPPPISIKSSPRKLPVKRRTPDSSTSKPTANFNFVSPKLESTLDENVAADADARPPPFKFHRIWTEPDEIRFLQGLLDCASQRLSFPRDLHVFYDRFSNTMPQPYTKSQLSEKLRRLRKKFRILSSRVARGLNPSLLSPQDRALYELSEKLWSPEFSSTSPFGNNSSDHSNNKEKNKKSESNLVGVKVSFSPTLPILSSHSNQNLNFNELDNADDQNDNFDDESQDGDVKMSEVSVENDEEDGFGRQSDGLGSGGLGGVAAKTVLDVFDQCLKEVRMVLVRQGLFYSDTNNSSKPPDFDTRWQQQRIAELDVFARRLRLVLHNSLRGQ